MYNGSLVLLSWSPFDGFLWDILQPFPATVGRNDIIISNLLSCSISWDASCRNSFYMAQSTWPLLVSTNPHGPASLSRRPLLWISFRKKHVFEGISWSFFFFLSKNGWAWLFWVTKRMLTLLRSAFLFRFSPWAWALEWHRWTPCLPVLPTASGAS